METQAARKQIKSKQMRTGEPMAHSGGAGDSELLQVVHEHLQADVVCQDRSTGLLRWGGGADLCKHSV